LINLNLTKIHIYVCFSCNKYFLSFLWNAKVTEDFIQSGSEDHTFGSINIRNYFTEDKLTPGKNRLRDEESLLW